MKKILLFVLLAFLASTYGLCQSVTFTGITPSPLTVPLNGTSGSGAVNVTRPANSAATGTVYIYAKGGSGNAVKVSPGFAVNNENFTGNSYVFTATFTVTPSNLNNVNGVVYAQFEAGVNYKSADVAATVPVFNNSITAPAITTFTGSGNPAVIAGSGPSGGTGSYAYQWEFSTTSSTSGYNVISGATSQTYDPPSSTPPTNTVYYYRRKVNSGGNSNYSNVVTITINIGPIGNNTITYGGAASFPDAGDPTTINGSTPNGGSGTFAYQWQLATLVNPSNFTDIQGVTTQNYDPPALQYTTYYRRKVTSGTSAASYSNVVTIMIVRTGATMANPINIGNFNLCQNFNNTVYAFPEYGYGNEYGNSTDDVFYRFDLTAAAKISLYNCKQDGVSGSIYLLNGSGNTVAGGTQIMSCDVGYQLDYVLPIGTYYIVSEGAPEPNGTIYLPVALTARPNLTTSSPNVTITAGTSTTLQAFGTGLTYTWSPSTGLNSTTGASVIASPAVTTTYTVWGTSPEGCSDVKSITVDVNGSVGSTFSNPIVANIGGCGYYSGMRNSVGYGNEYGGSADDIYFKFSLTSASEVSIYAYTEMNFHLFLLNGSGGLIDEQYYSWVDSGDEAGSYMLVLTDGTPLKPTLQPGTYYVVAEGTNGNGSFAVGIETPSGYGCRRAQPIFKSSYHGGTQSSNSTKVDTVDTAFSSENADNDLLTIGIYPNPAKDQVLFSLKHDEPATVHFLTVNGMDVKQAIIAGKSTTVIFNDLPSGLYLLKIVQGNRISHKKLMIE